MKKMERLATEIFQPLPHSQAQRVTGGATRRGTGGRTGALPNPDFHVDFLSD